MKSRPLTSSRSDPLSPRSNHFPLAFPTPGTGYPSPRPPTVFPFRPVSMEFISMMFGAQRLCYKHRVTSFPNVSLRMGVSSQLPRRAVYMSGGNIPVVMPFVGDSGIRARAILLFSSLQPRHQSWAIPRIFSRCCVCMNFPPLIRPIVGSMRDSPALVLASQLPTRWKEPSQPSTSSHEPLPSSSTRVLQ